MATCLSIILADQVKRARLERRFWPKVGRADSRGCWSWLAATNAKGYGRMSAGRNGQLKAHQVSWALSNGPIPEGLCILHECDNPSCCNPEHLFLGTKKDNTHDMMRKGRMKPPPTHLGDAHPRAVLTTEKVLAIKSAMPLKHGDGKKLAAALGVSSANISRVVRGAAWRHVK